MKKNIITAFLSILLICITQSSAIAYYDNAKGCLELPTEQETRHCLDEESLR